MAQSLRCQDCASGHRRMTLKIERISGKRRTRIRLSGAFRSEHRAQVKARARAWRTTKLIAHT
jgi:alkylhydroperoxidase family enzyme